MRTVTLQKISCDLCMSSQRALNRMFIMLMVQHPFQHVSLSATRVLKERIFPFATKGNWTLENMIVIRNGWIIVVAQPCY